MKEKIKNLIASFEHGSLPIGEEFETIQKVFPDNSYSEILSRLYKETTLYDLTLPIDIFYSACENGYTVKFVVKSDSGENDIDIETYNWYSLNRAIAINLLKMKLKGI